MGLDILNGLFCVSCALVGLAIATFIFGPVYAAAWLRPMSGGTNRPSKLFWALPLIVAGLAVIGAFGIGYFGALTSPTQSTGA